eukprot:2257647-Prymnesium_polylepis.1
MGQLKRFLAQPVEAHEYLEVLHTYVVGSLDEHLLGNRLIQFSLHGKRTAAVVRGTNDAAFALGLLATSGAREKRRGCVAYWRPGPDALRTKLKPYGLKSVSSFESSEQARTRVTRRGSSSVRRGGRSKFRFTIAATMSDLAIE